MKKIFSLFLAVACCSMAFGQIISVTDGTLSDWDNVPSDYLFKTECTPNASMNGLKSVQVYVDLSCINLLIELNDDVITDREWTPFHVYINSDNNSSTGGFGDQWTDADTDLMLETSIFASGADSGWYPYNPAVFKWWGPVGGFGDQWTDPNSESTFENGWGALVPEASLPIGNSQMVEDGKIEIQLDYTLIPMPFDKTTFTLGFDIQQNWTSVGVLPNANDAEDGSAVLAEKLRIYVHPQNKTAIDGIKYKVTSNAEPYTAEVFYFNKDASITEIAIPKTIALDGITYTVTSIGAGAFSGCSSLTSISIPNSVTSIGARAFYGCSSLPVENNLRYADTYLVEAVDKTLSTYSINEGTKWIGDWAFASCFSLTSITIPNSVTSIGKRAFFWCYSLTSITIPNSVTSIGEYAFYDCSSLTSITIPNSVTNIGEGAFLYCSSLTTVICHAVVVPSIDEYVFYKVPTSSAVLYVPAVSIDDYKAAGQWRDFGTILPLEEAPSAVEDVEASTGGIQKLLHNGQVIIIHDGVEYTIMGQEL